jgi:hypothetical protein
MGALDLKPVSLICKMLPQTTAPYSGYKVLQREALTQENPKHST